MITSHWTALRGSARAAFRTGLVYRLNVATAVIGVLLQVLLLNVVWRSVYGGAAQVQGIRVGQAVSYAVLAACLQMALIPWQFSSLNQRVRNGQVGIDMTRPIGLLPQVLAHNVGTFLAQIPIAGIGIMWAVAIGALTLPPHVATVAPWLLATTLGIVLTLLMNLLMSLACFWSLEISGYLMLYRLGSALLSGVLVPLWFMPDWLAGALNWLPFRAQMFTPLSIYFGQISGSDVWLAILAQLGWISVIVILLRIVWLRAKHKVVVLGG